MCEWAAPLPTYLQALELDLSDMVDPVGDIREVGEARALCGLAVAALAECQHDEEMMLEDAGADHVDYAPLPASSPSLSPSLQPSLRLPKSPSFVPPARPSSTPFPNSEPRSAQAWCLGASDGEPDLHDHDRLSTDHFDDTTMTQALPATSLEHLPTEVHESVLDHIFGYCVSATSRSAMRISSLTRGWSSAFRHSRRKELTSLALVNHTWRVLVQQRLFRHIKLKATIDSIDNATAFLTENPHLAAHVKHIEVWFPVFQPTYGPLATSNTLALPTVTIDGLTNATYTLPENNCTLEEIFRFVGSVLTHAKVLTLEGGERRKAPKTVHFKRSAPNATAGGAPPQFHALASVRTLVTKGQWNLVRDLSDFSTIMNALPNLEEWHGSYSKPKSKSYITASSFLPMLPKHATNLCLCMENDYRRETVMPAFFYKVAQKAHICASLAQVLPSLEHFAYTGRICHHVFNAAMRHVDPLTSRLKSIDITVKNCCRIGYGFQDSGSGIQDMAFIEAFERLVIAAVKSMEKFKSLEYLRIRFVDLDSIFPPLNPFFLMQHGSCSGVWSEFLVKEIDRVRPGTKYTELSESFGQFMYGKDGRMMLAPECARARPVSLKFSNYQALASRIITQ